MNKSIPIVFCIDHRMVMQLGVTITSLMLNANGTEYDIIVVIDETVLEEDRNRILSMKKLFGVSITLVTVTNQFDSLKISNPTWSKACYYRLLLPNLLPNYDTVIYSDVDIVFQSSLAEAFCPIDDYYVAACQDVNTSNRKKRIRILDLAPGQIYFCAGFMIMNLKKFRELGLVQKALELSKRNFVYMDQDVLNYLCKGHVYYLSPFVCRFSLCVLPINPIEKETLLTPEDITRSLNVAAIHYISSSKPWNSFCHRWEVWWHYYMLSPFFDHNFYRQRQYELIKGSNLSFIDRCKLLGRYFTEKGGPFRRLFSHK